MCITRKEKNRDLPGGQLPAGASWMIYQEPAHKVTSLGGRHFRDSYYDHEWDPPKSGLRTSPWPLWAAYCLCNHCRQLILQHLAPLAVISLSWRSSSPNETHWQCFPSETALACWFAVLLDVWGAQPGLRAAFWTNMWFGWMWGLKGVCLYLVKFHAGARKQ